MGNSPKGEYMQKKKIKVNVLYTFHVKCIPKYFMCLDIFVNDSGFENKFLIFHCSFLYVDYVS